MSRFINQQRARIFVAVVALCLAAAGRAAANPEVARTLEQRTTWVMAGGSMGSGVLVDVGRKQVLTAYHVVDEKDTVEVFFPLYVNGEMLNDPADYLKPENRAKFSRKGRVVARNRVADLAVIEVDRVPEGLSAVPLAGASPRKGETVHYIGNSGLGIDGALWRYTRGTVRNIYKHRWSARGEEGGKVYDFNCRMVEVQSETNGGDSGGPMVNDRGELVGIVSGGTRMQTGVKFSIDVREIRSLLDSARDGVPASPAVPVVTPSPNRPAVANPLAGTWKRTDSAGSGQVWEFKATGRFSYTIGNGKTDHDYRFAGGVLTVIEGGEEKKYRIEFTGGDRMRATFIANGYQTDWAREETTAPAPAKPAAAGSITGTWKRTDGGIGRDTRHTWEFQASGRSINVMDFGTGTPSRQEATYRFADGVLTLVEGGKEKRYRVEFDGPDRIKVTYLENGYKTDWVREGKAAPSVPAVPTFPTIPSFPPPAAEPAKIIGAWDADDGKVQAVFYFMTNGKYLFYTHRDRVVELEVEGTYRFEAGLLTLELPNGKKLTRRVESMGPGRLAVSDPQNPNAKDTFVKPLGDVTLKRPGGGTVVLDNK